MGLTTETGGRGTETTPSAPFTSAPDTDRQTDGRTHTDKGTDRPSRKDAHRVRSDRHVRVCTQARTRAHTHRVSVRGESACVGGLGSEPGPLQPGQASPAAHRVPASLPLCLCSLMPKGIFSSSCQSIMKVHSTIQGISGGWALGVCTPRLALLGAGRVVERPRAMSG